MAGYAAGVGKASGAEGRPRSDGWQRFGEGSVKMLAAGVKCPVFVIAADAVPGLIQLKGSVDPAGEAFGVGNVVGRETSVVFGKVKRV
jgi:hypothetical protein